MFANASNEKHQQKMIPISADLTFPGRLFIMLEDAETEGFSETISWSLGGKAFCIHLRDDFEKTMLKRYFKMSKYSSFTRALSAYGFTCVSKGGDKRVYFHSDFRKDNPDGCYSMKRISKGKKAKESMNMQQNMGTNVTGMASQASSITFPGNVLNYIGQVASGSVLHGAAHTSIFASNQQLAASNNLEKCSFPMQENGQRIVNDNEPIYPTNPATAHLSDDTRNDLFNAHSNVEVNNIRNGTSPQHISQITAANPVNLFEGIVAKVKNSEPLRLQESNKSTAEPLNSIDLSYLTSGNVTNENINNDSLLFEPRSIEQMIAQPNNAWYNFHASFDPNQQAISEYTQPLALPVIFFYLTPSTFGKFISLCIFFGHTLQVSLTDFGPSASNLYLKGLLNCCQHQLMDCMLSNVLVSALFLYPDYFGANRNIVFNTGAVIVAIMPYSYCVTLKTNFQNYVAIKIKNVKQLEMEINNLGTCARTFYATHTIALIWLIMSHWLYNWNLKIVGVFLCNMSASLFTLRVFQLLSEKAKFKSL